jgi:hypothetical protein
MSVLSFRGNSLSLNECELKDFSSPSVRMRNGPPAVLEEYDSTTQTIQGLFQNRTQEQVKYETWELASTGTTNGSGRLKPFTNYTAENPYTYRSNLLPQESEKKMRHEQLADAVITKYLEVQESPIQTIQASLKEGHFQRNRALQVAAALRQVGDGLAPIPMDHNPILIEAGVLATFNPQQTGFIVFHESESQTSPIHVSVWNEVVDVKLLTPDQEGPTIQSFMGQRTISVELPDSQGAVSCHVIREFFNQK